ncbi:MAG: VWA domain-containing protein [Verrucomicrobiota bacterium]
MKFAEPTWLLAGLVFVAAMLWFYHRFDRRQRAALAEFASSHLLARLTASFSPTRRLIKRGLFVGAVFLVCVALARPQWGYHWEEQKERGIDILFAIDTSKSMLTQDVTPDRLTRAKLAIVDFVRQLQGDRVGLIAFAGDAFLQAPLTLDADAFEESLDAVDTSTIPRGGTDIASAITEAQAAFGPGQSNKKILVLITDGEDLEAKGIDAARSAARDGMVIYTVGVGTASGGLIPVAGANGGTDFVKDASGQFVKSHLDENTLSQIAQVTGGIYQPLGQQGQGLQAIYDKALVNMPKEELASKRAQVYEERYQWPLAAGLALLLASLLVGTRRNDRPLVPAPRPPTRRVARPALAATAAVLALALVPSAAQASVGTAHQAYKNGDYATAEKQYEQAAAQHPDEAAIQFNYGAAAYKSGGYDAALPAFQKALNTEDVGVQQQAYYNMGNTQYRLGQKTEKASPQQTMQTWQSAVQSYDAALKLKPDDADAKYNRDFVEKKLKELQKQNPPPQKQQNQDQQNKDQQKNDQQQNQQQQQNQNQNQNQDQKQDQQQNSSGSQNNQSQGGQQQGQGNPQDQKQNGQNQAGNDQRNQQNQPDQKGQQQGGQQKDQQQQTAGNQGQQQQNGNQQQNGGQQMAGNDKQAGPRGATIPDKDQGAKADPSGDAQAAAGKPGELTKDEAKELLDSLKNGEHVLPVTADARNAGQPQDQPVLKDW